MLSRRSSVIHSLIGIALMLVCACLPPVHPEITVLGMRVLGVFLGTLYLWITVGGVWPSLLCAAALAVAGFSPNHAQSGITYVLNSFLGNPTMMLILFIMLLSNALDQYGVTRWIALKLLNMKALRGHPWKLILSVTYVSFLMAVFINPFTPIFLFWPILEEIFRRVGYRKMNEAGGGELLPKLMLVLLVAVSIVGYAVPGYMGTPLVLISSFAKLADGAEEISISGYVAATMLTGILMTAAMLLSVRFFFRPDVSKLAEYEGGEEAGMLNVRQKILIAGFSGMVVLMLLPTMLPSSLPVVTFLKSAVSAMPLFLTVVFAMIPLKDGPVLDVSKVLGKGFSWNSYFLCGAAILIGGALTSDVTGISGCLKEVLSPLFSGMPKAVFLVILVLLAVLVTNFCNSLVVMLVLEPVIRTYLNVSLAGGMSGAAITTVVMMAALMTALLTPAASPFAAVLYANTDWYEKKDIRRIALPLIGAESAVIFTAGIPLAAAMV